MGKNCLFTCSFLNLHFQGTQPKTTWMKSRPLSTVFLSEQGGGELDVIFSWWFCSNS